MDFPRIASMESTEQKINIKSITQSMQTNLKCRYNVHRVYYQQLKFQINQTKTIAYLDRKNQCEFADL